MRIINKYILLIIYQIQQSYSTAGTIRIIISFQFRKFGHVRFWFEGRIIKIFSNTFCFPIGCFRTFLWPLKDHSFSRRRFVVRLVLLLSNRRQFIRNPKISKHFMYEISFCRSMSAAMLVLSRSFPKTVHVVYDWQSLTLHVGFHGGCVPIWRTLLNWRRCIVTRLFLQILFRLPDRD